MKVAGTHGLAATEYSDQMLRVGESFDGESFDAVMCEAIWPSFL